MNYKGTFSERIGRWNEIKRYKQAEEQVGLIAYALTIDNKKLKDNLNGINSVEGTPILITGKKAVLELFSDFKTVENLNRIMRELTNNEYNFVTMESDPWGNPYYAVYTKPKKDSTGKIIAPASLKVMCVGDDKLTQRVVDKKITESEFELSRTIELVDIKD